LNSGGYVVKRLVHFIPVFFGVTALVFFLLRLAPGDAAHIRLQDRGMDLSEENLAAARAELGLDRPLWGQYVRWLGAVFRLDLGVSIVTGEPVAGELGRRFRLTLYLTLPAMALVLIAAFPLGLLAALHQGKLWDRITRFAAIAAAAVPSFCRGLVFILVFSTGLRWFPSFGAGSPRHLVLPCLVLFIASAAHYTRFIRSALLEELSKEYIRAARARGIGTWTILIFHGIRNALIPIITSLGMSLSLMLGGSAVVEKVFSWPGMGSCLIDSILNRDYPVVQGCVLLYAFLFTGVNVLTDMICILLDPKVGRNARNCVGGGE
jgi:peptide/nickel transport system permease protein/nickel transport system permease protein